MLSKCQREEIESPEIQLSVFPIRHPRVWEFYLKARDAFWIEKEINDLLSKDKEDWKTLDPRIQKFVKHILAFFAISDAIVNDNIANKIVKMINTREYNLWYNFQMAIEDIHNIMYSTLVDTYIEDEVEKNNILTAAKDYDTIRKKIEWVQKWLKGGKKVVPEKYMSMVMKLQHVYENNPKVKEALSDDKTLDEDINKFFADVKSSQVKCSLAMRVLVNVIMEGIFFSGSFCAIYWLYGMYGKMPGLSKANEFISRDEGLHAEFGVHLYRSLKNKLPQKLVHTMIIEAMEIESKFICDALPDKLLGMNSDKMSQYLKFVSDKLLTDLGYAKIFNATCPFDFMNKQSTSVRLGDFFSDSISEYGLPYGTEPSDDKIDFEELDI